jgi:hypothetical protein
MPGNNAHCRAFLYFTASKGFFMNATSSFVTCIALAICSLQAYGQGDAGAVSADTRRAAGHNNSRERKAPSYQIAYLGFSGGINNPVGLLGLQLDLAFSPQASINTGIGISSWGYKAALEGRYYFKPCNRGWAAAFGLTYSTGGKAVKLNNIETSMGNNTVVVDMSQQANLMISAYHFFNLGMRGTNRFHLQLGYSIPLTEPRFTTQYNYYAPSPTEKGRNTIRALAPGGIILGLGFSFGTGKSR